MFKGVGVRDRARSTTFVDHVVAKLCVMNIRNFRQLICAKLECPQHRVYLNTGGSSLLKKIDVYMSYKYIKKITTERILKYLDNSLDH